MGYEELNRTVRGSGGTLATNTTGVVQTDNYIAGGTFTVGNGTNAYPYTVDPAGATIQELTITETGSDIRADLTLKDGSTVTGIHLRGAALVEDTLEIDAVTFKDPNATGKPTFGYWSGE